MKTDKQPIFVRCTDASGGIIGWLTKGEMYEVDGFHYPNYVKLVGCEYLFKTWRFKSKETQ